MAVLCPYCSLNIELTGVKAGRFSPRCPRCGEKFVLIIPQDPARPPEVLAIKTSNQTHVLPALQEGQTTLAEEPAPRAAETLAPTPTVAPVSPARRPAEPERPRLTPTRAEVTAPPADTSVFAAKRGKYADWDDSPPAPADPAPSSTPRESAHAMHSAGADQTSAPPRHHAAGDRMAAPPDGALADVPPQPPRSADTTPGLTGSLGGYDIQHKLGAGGMGAVYLARQVSLDRNVALKVLLPQYASDPQFVARFTREAYAAAQLTHHNVVQIHDIGADRSRGERELHFFSMEFVEGQTLADLVRKEGRQDPDVAVGYVLQAARGLKFAHDHGMIHRDIKPDNLLLNRQGIVKVADLGLVKTPGTTETVPRAGAGEGGGAPSARTRSALRARLASHVTEASAVFGTPAFMAPEQAEDATRVDQRADIYSLGCTLYHLLTGNPPFGGKTAMEVMTRHAREQVIPPDVVCRHVSPELSQVVVRMMAKRPEDRYGDLGEVIEDLEAYLGVESHGPFTPREEHVRLLEAAVDQFYEASAPRLRRHLIAAFVAVCLVGVIAAGFFGSVPWASGFVALGMLAPLFYFLVSGAREKTYLFARFRHIAAITPLREWLKGIAGVALLGAAVVVLGWHWAWLGFAVLALLGALALHGMVDGSVRKQRAMPLRRVEDMLRTMRLKGLEEGAIRQFVCKYAGDRWEEFFESLFGYEAKMEARHRWGKGDRGSMRRRFRAWRDPIIRWIDEKEAERKAQRDRQHIQSVEVKALEAAGVDMVEARRQGKKRAQRMVEAAAVARQTALRHAPTVAPGEAPPPEQVRLVQAIVSEEDPPDVGRIKRDHEMYLTRRYGGPLDVLFGGTVRFALAAVLLFGFLMWRYQNHDFDRGVAELKRIIAERVDPSITIDQGGTVAIDTQKKFKEVLFSGTLRLEMEFVPASLARLVSRWSTGLAGLLLLLSVPFRGKLFALAVLAAAAVALFGPELAGEVHVENQSIPPEWLEKTNLTLDRARELLQHTPLPIQSTCMAVAAGMFVVAVIFLRDREPG